MTERVTAPWSWRGDVLQPVQPHYVADRDAHVLRWAVYQQIALTVLLLLNSPWVGLPATTPSPFGRVILSDTTTIVLFCLGVLGLSSLYWTRSLLTSHYHWRIYVTTVFSVYSAMFIYATGNTPESHFHAFLSLTFLAVVWEDWRLPWISATLTTAHHMFIQHDMLTLLSHVVPLLVAAGLASIACHWRHAAVMQVIGDRQRLMEAHTLLKQSQEHITQVNEVLARQIANKADGVRLDLSGYLISHDLRVLLKSIVLVSEELERGTLSVHDSTTRERLNRLRQDSSRLKHLIEELLERARRNA